MKSILTAAAAALVASHAWGVTIDLVPIGDPNNSPKVLQNGVFGRVTSAYQIGETEVTNAQYVEFLNAKAASDPLGLYNASMGMFNDGGIVRSGSSGSYTYAVKAPAAGVGPGGSSYTFGDKPVNYVSWYDAIRFANWMNNGQGTSSTETGAYTLLGGTAIPSNADSITRNAGATWFLPTENQWFKAAYYNPATSSYTDYPTDSDAAPDNHLPSADTGNSANYLIGNSTTTGNVAYHFTPVGAYEASSSAYGTFDQGGNVAEWNETLVSAGQRGRRGGSWDTTATDLSSATRGSVLAYLEFEHTGFRLATSAAAVSVAGDYNGNGAVDAADFVMWRDHLGTTYQLLNEVAGTTPGTVTAEDYSAWRARFGNTSGSGSGLASMAAVPEPNVSAIAIVGVWLAAWIPLIGARSVRRQI